MVSCEESITDQRPQLSQTTSDTFVEALLVAYLDR
jgi:hypothetical protein